MSPFETVIETPRLLLRVPRMEDFDAWTAMMADEDTARYIGGVQKPPVVWRAMASIVGSFQLVGFGMFSLIEKATGEWIGRAGPWRPHGWPGPEVGWGLIRSKWGQGYALEATTACMNWVVDVLEWPDIIHTIHPGNANSQKLAQRLGSTNRGPGKLPPPLENETVEIWGQTADQWRARRGA
ncbi:MAG: GNAT family N-acetyltransferase [Hyphomonadaceae bacterium]